jgi:hypothetical protein
MIQLNMTTCVALRINLTAGIAGTEKELRAIIKRADITARQPRAGAVGLDRKNPFEKPRGYLTARLAGQR